MVRLIRQGKLDQKDGPAPTPLLADTEPLFFFSLFFRVDRRRKVKDPLPGWMGDLHTYNIGCTRLVLSYCITKYDRELERIRKGQLIVVFVCIGQRAEQEMKEGKKRGNQAHHILPIHLCGVTELLSEICPVHDH